MNSASITQKLRLKLRSAVRYGMVHTLTGVMPLYVVNEYPKCGGTWLSMMLGRALEVPYPRNCFPQLRSSIMHGHYISPWGMNNVLVLWRDGRDVMVSWYHHCLFKNERENAPLVEKVRRDLRFEDYEDVKGNLPRFLEYSFTRQRHPRFSWAEFIRAWHGREGVSYVRYEDLRKDAGAELIRLVRELSGRVLPLERAADIVDEFSFARMSGRKPGTENKKSYMRKGIVGDWKNQFTREAREVFDHYAGEELMVLGYENDRSWVDA